MGRMSTYERAEAAVEHLVTFKTAEGREGNHTAASLDEAIRFVERLRNNEGASGVRVFRMQEVPIEFRTYYKVEVGDGKPDAKADSKPEPAPAAASPAEQPEPVMAAAANTTGDAPDVARRIFSRG